MKHRPHVALIPVALALTCWLAAAPVRAASITLSTTVRDFTPGTNADFERYGGDDRGIVQTTLGADGKPIYSGGSHPTITSATTFNQWYNNTASVNIAIASSITLNETAPGSGIYQYSSSAYFPVDGQGFGNYGSTGHNFHFTTEIHTLFTYQLGQNFSFTGDDDVFVFINDQLAIDLGGVHAAETGSVNLNTLGLIAGSDYKLDVFQAERHTSASTFAMQTSGLVLRSSDAPEPGSLALVGLGLLAAGASRLRRRGA